MLYNLRDGFVKKWYIDIIRSCFNHSSTKMISVTPDGIANKTSLDIKTFVFFDTETTGLPAEEHNKTKLTEFSMVAVQADHIRLGVFPRVQNKLNLCFSPRKLISFEAEKLTGLSNQLLENQAPFSSNSVNLINGFLSQHQSPICLVAHNGNNFDYPILRAEINKAQSTLADVFCIDSLKAFQQLYLEEQKQHTNSCDSVDTSSSVPIKFTDQYNKLLLQASQNIEDKCTDKITLKQRANETTPKRQIIGSSTHGTPAKKIKLRFDLGVSFKLADIYHRLTNKNPVNAHYAESDVLMLITCAATLGDKFVNWCNKNSERFCDIPAMTPGRKIGT